MNFLIYSFISIYFRVFKCDNNTIKIGSGDVDDLSKLSFLDEENIIAELRARYRKGQIYVSIRGFLQ